MVDTDDDIEDDYGGELALSLSEYGDDGGDGGDGDGGEGGEEWRPSERGGPSVRDVELAATSRLPRYTTEAHADGMASDDGDEDTAAATGTAPMKNIMTIAMSPLRTMSPPRVAITVPNDAAVAEDLDLPQPTLDGKRLTKKQTVSKIRALTTRGAALERDIVARLLRFRMAEGRTDFERLEQVRTDAETKRSTERGQLVLQIERTSTDIEQFVELLQRVSSAPSFVERVQRLMVQIEAAILKLKDAQRSVYESLAAKETLLGREIVAHKELFESWEKDGLDKLAKGSKAAAGKVGSTKGPDVLPEAKQLTAYLARNGGLAGRWTEYDHGVYLRERARHSNPKAALRVTTTKLIGKSAEECHEHELWYQEYLRLNDAKKVAIRYWKAQKDVEQAKELAVRQAIVSEQGRLAAELKARKAAGRKTELKRKADDVARWKQEQQYRQAAHEERLEQQRLAEAKVAQRRERDRHKAQKVKVDEYLAVKKAQEHTIAAAAEKAKAGQSQRATKAELAYFQARDQKQFQQRISARTAKAAEDEKRLARLERIKKQVRVDIDRDPSRLTRPTAASLARENDTSTAGRLIISGGARGVPSWRKT